MIVSVGSVTMLSFFFFLITNTYVQNREGEIPLFSVLTSDMFEIKPQRKQRISSEAKRAVCERTKVPKASGEVWISTHFNGKLIREGAALAWKKALSRTTEM